MLLELIEGDRHFRAHHGEALVWPNACRAWERFKGVPSQGAMARVQVCMLRLEGVYRNLDGDAERTSDGVIGAMARIVSSLLAGAVPLASGLWYSKALPAATAGEYGQWRRSALAVWASDSSPVLSTGRFEATSMRT